MRERSAADNFSLRAFPALLAASERSSADKLAARAFPPSFPSATAFGFFLPFIPPIIRNATLDVKVERWRLARNGKRPTYAELTGKGVDALHTSTAGTREAEAC